MSGYFSSVDEPYASSNNAARDYERLKGYDPKGFEKGQAGRLFDRLFAGQPQNKITSAPLPGVPAADPLSISAAVSSPAPTQNPGAPQPAISSGQSLIGRILQQSKPPAYNPAGEPLVPGTTMTVPQYTQAMQSAFSAHQANQVQQAPFGMPGSPGDVLPLDHRSGGAPLNPMQMGPMASQPTQSPYGNRQFGGNQFGGNTFGGNTFGGRQFGASAQPVMPGAQPGFFSGGHLNMMRGGYPANLINRIPTRFEEGNYVSEDGQGDGRSDHVPARLSPGEYVIDAETVALLGNGSNEAGARELDELRRNLRKQKGRALAEGRFSPDAKAPEAYMRGGR